MENASIILAATAFGATLLLIIYLFAANAKRVKKQKKVKKQSIMVSKSDKDHQADIDSVYRLEELTKSSNTLKNMATSNLNK